jgi:hypothetical protein
MPEELPHHESPALSPEKLQRIADKVAKLRYIHKIDEEMGDTTLPDITGLHPSDYDTDQELYNTVWTSLPPGSDRESVVPILRQIDQLIEDAGGLKTYLAAEAERRAQKDAYPYGAAKVRTESNPVSGEIAPDHQGQEVPPPENPNPRTRRKFGRSILDRFSGS